MIKFFIKKRITKLKKKYINKGSFLTYEEMKKINVICDFDDLVAVVPFFKNLSREGKKINIYCFASKENMNFTYKYPLCDFINKEDLNFFGFPKKEIIERFTNEEIDTIIDVSSHTHDFFSYLILHCPQKYKITISDSKNSMYNIIISNKKNEDINFFLKEMLFYIKNIRKKKDF